MNLKVVTSALLIAGLASSSAFAATGKINFTGVINPVACSVSGGAEGTGNPNFTVDLGAPALSDFDAVGATVGTRGFHVYIGGKHTCTNGTKVWATFNADALTDSATGLVRITDDADKATGVQIVLMNKNGEDINIWGEQNITREVVADNKATLSYAAAYRQTERAVTSGKANGAVVYTVHFEPAATL